MAMGQWYFVLRESLINVIQTTSTLRTLGVALGGNCGEENALQEQRDRCSRLLEVGFRADSLREHDSSYLMWFALVLSDLEQQRAAVRSFKEDFHFLWQMEECARGDDGLLEVRHHAAWRQDPLVCLLFMLWDRPRGDEIDNEALELTKHMFDHQRDTRLNEESNRLCKQNTEFQSHSVCSETRDQHACVMGTIVQRRKLGTTWEPNLENSSVKLAFSSAWFAHGMVQHLCLQIESGHLQHQKTNVLGLVHGNGCCIFIVKGCRRMYGPLESLGQLVASWNCDQRYKIGDDIPRFL